MKVLIVDDEILVRKGLALGIEWEYLGFEQVFEASNGREALKIIEDHSVDLVFTDIKMPVMDGLELIRVISSKYPQTVIIVLSCVNDSNYIREALKFNRAIDYIPKLSMGTDELTEIVQKAKKYIRFESADNGQQSTRQQFFTDNRYLALREAIDYHDEMACELIIRECLDEVAKTGLEKKLYLEWIEIYSLFSGKIKEIGADIKEMKLSGVDPFIFLNRTVTINELKLGFELFIPEFFSYISTAKGIYVTEEIKNVIKYVRRHYSDHIRFSDVADYIGLNESYLSKLFKKQMGVNFTEYLNQTRLEKSKKLLIENKLAVYEIALEVGYNSESYFCRIFKQYEGVSPKQFSHMQSINTK